MIEKSYLLKEFERAFKTKERRVKDEQLFRKRLEYDKILSAPDTLRP